MSSKYLEIMTINPSYISFSEIYHTYKSYKLSVRESSFEAPSVTNSYQLTRDPT